MADSNGGLRTVSSDALAVADLSDDAKKILHQTSTPAGDIAQLTKAGLFPDALKYLAQALEAGPCITWSVACARQVQAHFTQQEQEALTAVEKWLAQPDDENRRASQAAAEEAQLSSPAGCIAMATFFAEGSIAPRGLAEVPPPPHLAQKMASAAVILAVTKEPEKAAERYQQCVQIGLTGGH